MTEPATEKQVKFMKNLKIDVPEDMTKEEARLAIDRVLNKPEEPVEVVKISSEKSNNRHATMYTSYAKDIFCAILNGNKPDKEIKLTVTYDEYMAKAIELVKQAKEAFE